MKDLTVKELMQYLTDTYSEDTMNSFRVFSTGTIHIENLGCHYMHGDVTDSDGTLETVTQIVRDKIGEPEDLGGFTLEDLEFAYKSGYRRGDNELNEASYHYAWIEYAKKRGYIQEKLEPGAYWRYDGYTDWNKLESSPYKFRGAVEIKIVE